MTGDYSPFWAARDYLDDVDDIRASVFVVHGLNDWNVKTKAFAEWWYRLDRYGVPRKIWLHNGGHGGPARPGGVPYKATENRWIDHELFGVQNGIMSEPRATIQREDGSYSRRGRLARAGHERGHAAPVGAELDRSGRAVERLRPSGRAPGLRRPRAASSTPTTC